VGYRSLAESRFDLRASILFDASALVRLGSKLSHFWSIREQKQVFAFAVWREISKTSAIA
jgi:hypothetical protein